MKVYQPKLAWVAEQTICNLKTKDSSLGAWHSPIPIFVTCHSLHPLAKRLHDVLHALSASLSDKHYQYNQLGGVFPPADRSNDIPRCQFIPIEY